MLRIKHSKEHLRDEPQSSASVLRTTEQTDANKASLHNVTKLSFPPQGAMSPLSKLSSLSINSLASVNGDEIGGLPVLTSMPALTSALLTNTFTVGLNPVAQPLNLSHGTRQTDCPLSTEYHPRMLSSGRPMLYQAEQPVRASPPVLFGNQVPPVSKYSGNADSEPFEEWLEQFELVASVCNWEGQAKLANLVTRLQGQTYSFIGPVQLSNGPHMMRLEKCFSQAFQTSAYTISSEWVVP